MDKNVKQYKSASAKATIAAGKKIGAKLQAGDVIALYGNLGAGKTHLMKGIAEAFDFEGVVNSPTFTLINEYEASVNLYHFDLYRLNKSEQIFDLGIEEYWGGDGISVIEWADKAADLLPDSLISIYIEIVDQTHRIIKVKGLD